MRPQPHSVAARLGLDQTTIRRLQARGHLPRLALTEPEIRERLYHAHLAHALARAGGNRGDEGRIVSLPGRARALARRGLAWASLAPPVATRARTRTRWWTYRRPRRLGSQALRPRRVGLRVPPLWFRRIKAAPDAQAVPRARLLTLVVLLAALLLPSARASMSGQQRVLVVLATAGARPYTLGSVERALEETDAFFRRSSLGQTSLRTELVPWLTAFPTAPHCAGWDQESLHALVAPARAAAMRAGYAPDRWDRVVYVLPASDCGFRGVALGREAIISSTPRAPLLVHELGHTYGLAHAGATECPSCPILEQGDPFSPMGSGFVDFSAYEKHLLGWLGTPPRLAHDGSYTLSRADRSSPQSHALIVETGAGEYWLERRQQGLVIRIVDHENADRHDQRLREADAEQLARETRGTHHRRQTSIGDRSA